MPVHGYLLCDCFGEHFTKEIAYFFDERNICSTEPSDLLSLAKLDSLTELSLSGCGKIDDLSFLKNCKKLKRLQLLGVPADLSPLIEMDLESIHLDYVPERHDAILRRMKSLKVISGVPVGELLKD